MSPFMRLLGSLLTGQLSPLAVALPASDRLPAAEGWPMLIDLALRHGLGPILLWFVERAGIEIDTPLWAPLVTARRQSAVYYMMAMHTVSQVQTALAQADIPCLWLKGISLATTVYPEPDLRPMADLDLLVPYGQRHTALSALTAVGYHLLGPALFAGADELEHHYQLHNPAEGGPCLELHFRLLGCADRLLRTTQLDWFWAQSQQWTDGVDALTILRPEAHLLYLCAHTLLQHGEADFHLHRYYDLHRLISHSPAFGWQLAVDQAVRLGWTYAVQRGLALTHHFFDTELPAGLLEGLAVRRPAHEATAHVTRRQVSRDRGERLAHYLDTMEWPQRLQLLQRAVFPPVAYMRWRYGIPADSSVPFYYLCRWANQAAELYRMVGKQLRRR